MHAQLSIEHATYALLSECWRSSSWLHAIQSTAALFCMLLVSPHLVVHAEHCTRSHAGTGLRRRHSCASPGRIASNTLHLYDPSRSHRPA